MSYLSELNPSQQQAVEQIDGPLMIIAGAGSGKTRVLTYRIAYLIENGVDPFNILALTFTNKAAREMTERISKVIAASEAKNVTMGTFHSVFAKILRFNADRLGYPTNFTIYDSQDSKSLIKDVIKELQLDDKIYKPSMVLGRISAAKNNLISWEAYAEDAEIQIEDTQSKKPSMAKIYENYCKRCFKAGAMDFDDLLYQTNVLFDNFPEVLSYYQQKFRYILVDEYQDTNFAQYRIVKNLAALFENICVVGDDAQSIYSFRGANIQNILNFRKDYPEFKLFKLEQNYRSTKNIVEAANSVISKNIDQIKKSVWTDNEEGNRIKVIRTLTDNEEGKVVVNRIFDLKHQEATSYNDFAILYRTNKQSRSFEEALRKMNIPYKIFGGISFYQRKEIKDLLAYFRLTTNHNDEEALKRVINYPARGIGKTTMDKIIIASSNFNVSLWEIISNPLPYQLGLNGSTSSKLYEFVTMVQSFTAELHKKNAYDLAQTIAKKSGILKELYAEKEKGPEEVERYQNIEELLAGISEFVNSKDLDIEKTLSEFMLDVALLTDADEKEDEEKNYVTLMTIHSSKGLEFPHVFLVGLEENLFPSQMSLHSRTDLEEERRLFYVAVTRAMKTCTLSWATSRFNWGQISSSERSRFIDEINPMYLEMEATPRPGGRSLNEKGGFGGMGGGLNKKFQNPSPTPHLRKLSDLGGGSASGASAGDAHLKVGYNVMHETFGKGKVIGLEGDGDNKKATIFFPQFGSKTVLIRFAKLTVLES